MKKVFAVISCFCSLICYSQTITVSETGKLINLAEQSFVLEDPSKKLTIEDIRRQETGFKKIEKDFINFGISASAFWIKCIVRNETDQKLLLEIGNPTLVDILLYEFDSVKLLAERHSGSWLPFDKRFTADVNFQFPLAVAPGGTTTIYLRINDTNGTQFQFKAGTQPAFSQKSFTRNLFEGMFYGFMLVMLLYNLFLFFSLKDNSYLYYVLYIFFMACWNGIFQGYAAKYIWPSTPWLSNYSEVAACLVGMSGLLFAANFLQTKKHTPGLHSVLRVMFVLYVAVLITLLAGYFVEGTVILEFLSLLSIILLFITAVVIFRKGYKPAGYFLIAWSFLLISIMIYILKDYNVFPYNTFTRHSMQIGSAIEALLLSIALANRINILKREKEEANMQTLASMKENEKLIREQNILLEKKVEERTGELKNVNRDLINVIQDLKEMQTQLVQREKMASLGELTAGIAHEIQNPLNFVNNFSEVSKELLTEMKTELNSGTTGNAITIADDVIDNLEKINYHGKRADAIVKGMLQHSRTSSGKKELTDINALADEYLRLAYHGLRAKDKSFNAKFDTDFDSSIVAISIIPQDIGRVILNLINNAYYAVNEKQKLNPADQSYEPAVKVTSKKIDGKVELRVIDNGNGIPQKILDKIFQPFFTTKPAGQGTGLGLSLSYDIITKGHSGELKVETREGEGTTFIILLPTTDSTH